MPTDVRPAIATLLIAPEMQLRRFLPILVLAASRGGAVIAQVAVQLVVGAMAGAAGLGSLQLFTSWSCMTGELLGQGLPTQTLRSVSVHYAAGNGFSINRDLRRAQQRILLAWLVVAGVAIGILLTNSLLEVYPVPGEVFLIAVAALIAAPLFALLRLFAEGLKGASAPVAAVSLENLLVPSVILIVCGFCWYLKQPLTLSIILLAGLLGTALAPLILRITLSFRLELVLSRVPENQQSGSFYYRDLRALWANSVLTIAFLHLPFLIMPWYVETAEIGVYAVAHKLVNVITTLLILLSAVFGPAFARAAAAGRVNELRRLLAITQRISSMIFLPIALALLVWAGPLATAFNLDEISLRTYLLILGMGHTFNAVTGLSGVLLNMSGGAHKELSTLIGSMLIALVATSMIGPRYGAVGLACVFSAALAAKNVASYLIARQHLMNPGGRL